MITTADITRLLEQGENLALEFKDSQILSDPFKLARVMTAFANAERWDSSYRHQR